MTFDAVRRAVRSRLLVLGSVGVAAGSVALHARAGDRPGPVLGLVPLLLPLAGLVVIGAGFVVWRDNRDIAPRGGRIVFRSRRHDHLTAALTLLAGAGVWRPAGPVGTVLWALQAGLCLPLVAVSLADRPRLELTPGAVVMRWPWGSSTVPWAALSTVEPTCPGIPGHVRLGVERPELVTRTGWSRPTAGPIVTTTAVDAAGLARIITAYVADPAARAQIGTPASRAFLAAAADPARAGGSLPAAVR